MANVEFTSDPTLKAKADKDLKERKKKTADAEKEAQDKLKAAKLAATAAKKEIADIRRAATYEQSIRVWQELTAIKEKAEKDIAAIIEHENNNTVKGSSKLKGIVPTKFKGNFRSHYIYQHPGEKKAHLKGNDKEEKWVKEYLAEDGNSLADLIAKADSTVYKAFVANFIRKKKSTSDDDAKTSKKEKEEPAVDVDQRVQ